MASFSLQRTYIPKIGQFVSVNGSSSAMLECISQNSDSAEFQIPQLLYDDNRDGLKDAFVTVSVSNAFDNTSGSDFAGYLDTDNATLNESSDGVTFSAISISAYLNKVWVGQKDFLPVVSYTLSGNMTPKKVLQDLFSNLPDGFKTRIGLGTLLH